MCVLARDSNARCVAGKRERGRDCDVDNCFVVGECVDDGEDSTGIVGDGYASGND